MGTKRAIAMRCNQQQFDSIKDKLVDIAQITDFNNSNYLLNCYARDRVSNLKIDYAKSWTDEVHEEWNAEVFLEAYGIDKTWSSDELEFFNKYTEKWVRVGDGTTKIRVKPIDPQLVLQNEIVSKTGINIVTCCNCGSTLLHRLSEVTITCPDCGTEGEHPDLNY